MLVKPTMESLLKKVNGRYTLAILAAKRARQLVNGALPLATSETPNYVTLACEEIGKGKIVCVKGIHDIYIPLRPEIAAERLAAKAAQENARLQEALEETFSRNTVTVEDPDEIIDDLGADSEENESSIEDVDSLISKFIPSDAELDALPEEDEELDLEDDSSEGEEN